MSTMTVVTKITHKYLMNKTKWDLASWIMDDMDKFDKLEGDLANASARIAALEGELTEVCRLRLENADLFTNRIIKLEAELAESNARYDRLMDGAVAKVVYDRMAVELTELKAKFDSLDQFGFSEFIGAEKLRAELAALKEAGRWIPVSQLPAEGVPVVVLTDYGKSDVCRLQKEEGRNVWVNDMRPQHTDGSVIGWMPLPQPRR